LARVAYPAARAAYPAANAAGSPANPLGSPKANGAGLPVVADQVPTVLPVSVAPRVWLAELVGSMSMSAVLALLLCIVWAAVLRTNNVVKIAPCFFLTLACSWAVLVPAKLWTKSVNDSWRRRVTLMCLGILVGLLALWVEGYELPTLVSPGVRADVWYTGGLVVQGQEVPVAACYLAYFGLAFFLIRWWKMAERRRKHRFSFGSVCAAGLGCWILMLFIWPTDEQARAALIDRTTAIMALVMASAVIQVVSPWEAPAPPKARKLRLGNA